MAFAIGHISSHKRCHHLEEVPMDSDDVGCGEGLIYPDFAQWTKITKAGPGCHRCPRIFISLSVITAEYCSLILLIFHVF